MLDGKRAISYLCTYVMLNIYFQFVSEKWTIIEEKVEANAQEHALALPKFMHDHAFCLR